MINPEKDVPIPDNEAERKHRRKVAREMKANRPIRKAERKEEAKALYWNKWVRRAW